MSGYQTTIKSDIPPVLRERDGRWFIVVTDGKTTIEAPFGQWIIGEVFNRVVLPKVNK